MAIATRENRPMTRHPQPPLTDVRLNTDGDEARISREAADASHRLLEIEPEPSDETRGTFTLKAPKGMPLVAGGQGRTANDVMNSGTAIVLLVVAVLAMYGVVSLVADLWRAVGGAA